VARIIDRAQAAEMTDHLGPGRDSASKVAAMIG
jgi:hypothetical protein